MRERSWFIEGSGRARADYDEIVVEDAVPEKGRVVLSFHWHPRFVSEPPAKIERVTIGNDPVGFIGVIDPPKNFILEFDPILDAREGIALEVAEKLFTAIEESGMTRAEFARKIGRSKGYETRLLNGNYNLTIGTLAELAYYLDSEIEVSFVPVRR